MDPNQLAQYLMQFYNPVNYPFGYVQPPVNPMANNTTMQTPSPLSNNQPNPSAQTPQPAIKGRMITTIDAVAPNEIPMDGSTSIFPLQDGSAIYTKGWTADGTIKTTKYVPEETIAPVATNAPVEIPIESRIQDLLAPVLKEVADAQNAMREELHEARQMVDGIAWTLNKSSKTKKGDVTDA